MAKWALVIDNEVVETTDINPSGRFHPDMPWRECDAEVSVGWKLESGCLVSPQNNVAEIVYVPRSITPRQARLALLQEGLLSAVESAISAMDGESGERAKISWEYAAEISRDDQLLNGIAGELGLTPEQIDAMFIAAALL